MSKKLFVGGLSWGTSEESLKSAFEEFGYVEDVRIVKDRETGRSKGFGFVTFDSSESAAEAKDRLNQTQLDGRMIKVDDAQDSRR
ncbi:MAG: RNA recognition motif domain-containing protein [Oligoflexus sp.]